MTTTGRATAADRSPGDVAASLRGAPLARLLVRRDGDAIAAVGVLARALRDADVPVQVAVTDDRREREERATAGDPDAVTVAVGPATGADVEVGRGDRPAAAEAAGIARELATGTADGEEGSDGSDPAAPADRATTTLALAGVLATGTHPGEETPDLLDAARERGLERRPGVAVPTTDLVDGLAHSTLVHGAFSGTTEAAADLLADLGVDDPAALDEDDHRTVASAVAVEATEGPAPERAAETVEGALRPHAVDDTSGPDAVGAPAATLEGYADALDVAAVVDPAATVAHVLGHAGIEPVLDAWRTGAAAAHEALESTEQRRYDGVVVVDAGDAPPAVLARLCRDARSPEPVAIALGPDAIGVASREADARRIVEAVADAVGGAPDGAARRGVVRVPDGTDESTVVDAARERP